MFHFKLVGKLHFLSPSPPPPGFSPSFSDINYRQAILRVCSGLWADLAETQGRIHSQICCKINSSKRNQVHKGLRCD